METASFSSWFTADGYNEDFYVHDEDGRLRFINSLHVLTVSSDSLHVSRVALLYAVVVGVFTCNCCRA